jgi:hypothetical protein
MVKKSVLIVLMVSRIRPLRGTEVIDVGIKVYKAAFGTLIKVNFIPVLILAIIPVFLDYLIFGNISSQSEFSSPFATISISPLSNNQRDALIGAEVISFILSTVITAIVVGNSFKAVADAYVGRQPNAVETFRFAFRRIFSLVLISFLNPLIIIVGIALVAGLAALLIALVHHISLLAPLKLTIIGSSVLLIIGAFVFGIYLYANLMIDIPILLLESRGILASIKRSFKLTRKFEGHSEEIAIFSYLIALFVSSAFGIPFTILILNLKNLALTILLTIISSVVSQMIITPFKASVFTITYFDLRVRKEGYDLEDLLSQFGETTDSDNNLPNRALYPEYSLARPFLKAPGAPSPPIPPPPPGAPSPPIPPPGAGQIRWPETKTSKSKDDVNNNE